MYSLWLNGPFGLLAFYDQYIVIYHIFKLSIDKPFSNCIAVYCKITIRKYQPADTHLNLTFQGKLLSRHPWECSGELRPAQKLSGHTPN